MQTGKFIGPCYKCKSEMWLPQELYDAAMRGRSKITFFCAYGHSQVFADGETTEDILRRERDMLKQQMAFKDDVIRKRGELLEASTKEAAMLRSGLVKSRKRASAGVCPCCHRTVRQMALHMRSKHPDFKAEGVPA